MQSKYDSDIQQLRQYADYLNGLLNRTITDSRLTIFQRGDCLFVTRYQNDEFLPLELQPTSYLHFRQLASVENQRKIVVEECRYTFSTSPNPDDEDRWVFRYDYSLTPERNVPHAHLHVNAVCAGGSVKHVHFPTGRVSIEQIIAHLVLEHHVKSRRRNWLRILAESHQGFVRRRSDLVEPLFP